METKEVGNSGVWIRAKDYLPAPYTFFGGAEFSRDVVVQYTNGEQGIDRVHYPHGAFGGSTKPRFENVEYWLDYTIPPTHEDV